MSQPANTKHIPSLRFPEFSGEWEEKKLGDVSTIITGSTPSTAISEYYGGEKLFVSPVDIQGNRYVKTTKTTLTFSGFNQGRKVSKDSVLFVCIGSTIGKVAQAYKECITNQQINSLTANSNNENNFIFSLLELKAPKIRLLAGEQAVPQINKSDFSKLSFLFPKQKEQTKIAAFLSSVDTKIDQLSQKKSLLEHYKKGVMQQIFSQQIRFKADDGGDYPEWENQFLDSIANITMGSSPKSSAYNEVSTGLPLIQGNADINKRLSSPRIYTSEITKECFEGDILLSVRAPVGEVSRSVHHACIGRGVAAIRAKKKMNNDFLYQFLLWFEPRWASVSQGSTFEAVNSKDIKELVIVFPCIEEQTKIANFLSVIDSKIEQVAQQLEVAKQFKKGLLQQMFV